MDYYELSYDDAAIVEKALLASQSEYGQLLRLAERFQTLIREAKDEHRCIRLDYDTSAQILDALQEDGEQEARAILLRECYGDSVHLEG